VTVRFTTSYLPLDHPCRWLRGNHHGHSTISDGKSEPLELVKSYEAEGYDYIALSEHDTLFAPEELEDHTSMCLLPAVEVTSRFGQTLMFLGASHTLPARELAPREIMESVHEAGGLFIFNHPNWRPRPDYATDDLLDSMKGLRGMEIYCGVIERLGGEAMATDRWDRLLSKGWRVFGHGTDDQHEPSDQFIAWNHVQWPAQEPVIASGVIDALSEGRSYASTGVRIHRVGTCADGSVIELESDADEVRWVTRDGVICKKTSGPSGKLTAHEFVRLPGAPSADDGKPIYVRAELFGRGNATAWTQPFWLTASEDETRSA
jgi:hypothetical protein